MASDHSIQLELCDSKFWDFNYTWNSNEPKLTNCLRYTAFVWVPSAVFLVAFLYEFFRSTSDLKIAKYKEIPWNIFNISRVTLTSLLIVIKLLEAGSYLIKIVIDHNESNKIVVVTSYLISPVVQIICYSLLITTYKRHRRAGLHTSASVWLYLAISVAFQLVNYYSVIVWFNENRLPTSDHLEVESIGWAQLICELCHFPILVILFVFECYGDSAVYSTDSKDPRPDSPEIKASFFSNLTFWWFNKLLTFGYRNQIELSNLWKTLPRDQTSELVPLFRRKWYSNDGPRSDKRSKTYRLSDGNEQSPNNIFLVIWQLMGKDLLLAAFLKFLQDSLQYMTPMILRQVLRFLSSKANEPVWHGYFYASLMLVTPTIQSLIFGNYFYRISIIGVQIRSTVVGAIYRKAMLLSGSSRMQSTTGEMVNLMAVDSQRFQELSQYLNLIWSAPFQILLAVTLIYQELGWSVFVGLFAMIALMPLNTLVARYMKMAQVKVMKLKDERIKHAGEVLSGIRVIKLYAWENSFIANLFSFRNRELGYLQKIQTFDSYQVFLWNLSPFSVALVTFSVYLISDDSHVLNAEKAFVSIALFNLLRFPLTMLPNLVTSLVMTMVSAKRINRFLNSDELVKYLTRNDEPEALAIEGGTLTWSLEPESDAGKVNGSANPPSPLRSPADKATLKNIDLHVKPGSFVAIVGQVASGKSSLLSAILGEMHRLSGRFNICKGLSIAYVPQQAWIQNMTVQNNILFGSEYNDELYNQVLDSCSLRSDLETLNGGDQAEIGEKGINLSGGQKQRVSLARACYSNSDLYLLDDPLSALDSHVAKHVYKRILSSQTGMLRNKTRILATNSLFVLPNVDHIVVLKEGRIIESGSYEQLMAAGGQLADSMQQYWGSNNHEDDKEDKQNKQKAKAVKLTHPEADIELQVSLEDSRLSPSKDLDPLGSKAKPTDTSLVATDTGQAPRDLISTAKAAQSAPDPGAKLIDSERVEMGSVGYHVYMAYFRCLSFTWLFLVVFMLFIAYVFNVSSNLWLSKWASDSKDPVKAADKGQRISRLSIYAFLGMMQCLSIMFGSLALARGSVRSSRLMHASLLDGVMHSPMLFFDTTPLGRIVNRFAKDIDVVDSTIPGCVRAWLSCAFSVISTVAIICFSFVYFIFIAIPLAIVYLLIQKLFILTTRQLKRLESITRSPIYSNFNETISGISTIRAYDCVDRFVTYSDNLIDRNQSCSYPNLIANRWLSIRLEFFGNFISFCAAMFSVYYRDVIGEEVAGLTISYSMNITGTLSWLVRITSDLETHIVSVERILEYINNKREDLWVKPNNRPDLRWPNEGRIQFRDYSTRYREGTDLVLMDINLDIRPGEKIGIVGRTGSGKSSLSLSLFRILEAATGKISIDERDISEYGLHDLRSKLTIIPQDPVLFSGSLRFNLDPLKLHSDEEIWRAVQLAHLKEHIKVLNAGLDHQVSEYGENFSVGQRQLICLARAILRKSRILVLDEATASVDLETDSVVQKTIRDVFGDCTIITIAHRIHTILDSNRILVLEKGVVKELDTPANLMSDTNSAFFALLRDAGLAGPNGKQTQENFSDSNSTDTDDSETVML